MSRWQRGEREYDAMVGAPAEEALSSPATPPPPPLRRGIAGSEQPVVRLHALGLDWRMWEPVMAPLAAGRHVVAYDLRRHGSSAGSRAPLTTGRRDRKRSGRRRWMAASWRAFEGLDVQGRLAASRRRRSCSPARSTRPR